MPARPSLPAALIAVLLLILAACSPPAASPSPEPDEAEAPETEAPETGEPAETEAEAAEVAFATILRDEAGTMKIDVPRSWNEIDTNDLWVKDGEAVGYIIAAAPDQDAFNSLDAPGVFFAASETLVGEYSPDDLLDDRQELAEFCEYLGREPYEDPAYTGVEDVYVNCDGSGAEFHRIAAEATDGSHAVFLDIGLLDEEDVDAYVRIRSTFAVTDLPDLP